MLTIDDILDRVGDGLSSWVVGDVFGRGIDDEMVDASILYTRHDVCRRLLQPMDGADGQQPLSNTSIGCWCRFDGGILGRNHH